MWEKVRNWGLGVLLFLASLAAGIGFTQRKRAEKAADKINSGKIEDATQAGTRQANASELKAVKEQIGRVKLRVVPRTVSEVEAELRKRGRVE